MKAGRATAPEATSGGVVAVGLVLCFSFGRRPGAGPDAWSAAADRVVRPWIDLLERPDLPKLCASVPGALLEWLEEHDPTRLERLVAAVVDRRVELVLPPHGGALLPAIPERDAIGQLQVGLRWWRQHGDVPMRGAWLPWGVWDPSLARLLGRLGFHYTVLDEGQLFPPVRPDGYYLTEREGTGLAIFPTATSLAHLCVRESPERVVEAIQAAGRDGFRSLTLHLSDAALGSLTDATAARNFSGKRAWLPRFLSLCAEQASWLKVVGFSTVLDRMRPTDRTYPPASVSHAVSAAALGAGRGDTWLRLRHACALGDDPSLEQVGPFLRPPPWEQVLATSGEVHRLHKRMLLVSATVLRLKNAVRGDDDDVSADSLSEATAALYRGQDAAAFVVGAEVGAQDGLTRHLAYQNLIRAEHLARTALGEASTSGTERADYDCDGRAEVIVRTPWACGIVSAAAGGALVELDVYDLAANVLNVATRRPEVGHLALQRSEELPTLVDDGDTHAVEIDDGDGPPPPAQAGLASVLQYDRCAAAGFLDHFLGPLATLDNARRGRYPELGDFAGAEYQLLRTEEEAGHTQVVTVARDGTVVDGDHARLLRIVKRYAFSADGARLEVRYEVANRYHEPIRTRMAVALGLNVDSSRGAGHFVEVDGIPVDPITPVELEQVHDVALVDGIVGNRVIVGTSAPATAWTWPIETVGRTPEGLGLLHQGHMVWLVWPLELWGQEKRRFTLTLAVEGA